MKNNAIFKYFSISLIWIWLLVFALFPYLIVAINSILEHNNTLLEFQFTLKNYLALCDPLFLHIFVKSFYLAGMCTLLCLILGYPFAYTLTRLPERFKNLCLLLVVIPFWTSSLIRSYAMMAMLKSRGIVNTVLLKLGIIHLPLQMLFTNSAVIICLVYNLLPFMILPLYSNIERLDIRLIEAARDLGANKFTAFTKIIIPLTLPGILAGCILVFLPAMTLFYIPDLLGGAKSMLLGNLIQNEFLAARNWPLGSAISVILTLVVGLMLIAYWRSSKNLKGQELL